MGTRRKGRGGLAAGGRQRGAPAAAMFTPGSAETCVLSTGSSLEQPRGAPLGRDRLGAAPTAAECAGMSPRALGWEMEEEEESRHRPGPRAGAMPWDRQDTGPCCSCHQPLAGRGQGTGREQRPALQRGRRRMAHGALSVGSYRSCSSRALD